ncbi:hypothetical protein [Archangium violaceum]|nr:hypothetical protein [Archangium violaceum]
MTPSLRGQRAASAALLGLVTLVTAGALVAVTTWMGRDSEPGQGSTFSVRLPATDAPRSSR